MIVSLSNSPAMFVFVAGGCWMWTTLALTPRSPRRVPVEGPVYGRRPIPAPSHTRTAEQAW